MKIAITTIFYQSKTELERLLDSIPPNVIDYFIAVDGVFKFTKERYPDLPDISTDGSLDILLNNKASITNKFSIVYTQKLVSTEFDKRNSYLETAKDLGVDIIIIVDSDEYFVYDPGSEPSECWTIFKRNLDIALRRTGHNHNVFGI